MNSVKLGTADFTRKRIYAKANLVEKNSKKIRPKKFDQKFDQKKFDQKNSTKKIRPKKFEKNSTKLAFA